MKDDKTFTIGRHVFAAADYGSMANAILGIRDSGKTYTATEIAEKLFDCGVPFTAFDPIGIWRFMRIPGAGKGYPVVVVGGDDADLPLTVRSAPEIMRAAMRNGVSVIIDLFIPHLSKADWRRIVTSCVEVLLHENTEHGLRHVFLEEAAEFIPQKINSSYGGVYAAVEKLARMGGNSRLGLTIINQRAEEVNKAVLELCGTLFLHRQKGRNSLTALQKWMTLIDAKESKEIIASMPSLPTGECWIFPEAGEPTREKVGTKNSLHPDRRIMRGDDSALVTKRADVGSFVETMRKDLLKAELARKAASDEKGGVKTPGDIADIHRVPIAALPRPQPENYAQAAYDRGYQDGLRQVALTVENVIRGVSEVYENATGRIAEEVKAELRQLREKYADTPAPDGSWRRPEGKQTSIVAANGTMADGVLSGALQRVINAIAWWRKIGREPIERGRVAIVAGYSPTASTIHGYIAELSGRGLVEVSSGKVKLTQAGLQIAEHPTAATAKELYQMARSLLQSQPARIFDVIYSARGGPVTRIDVAERVGLSTTASTIHGYIAEIAGYGIIENAGPGKVRAADWLFP